MSTWVCAETAIATLSSGFGVAALAITIAGCAADASPAPPPPPCDTACQDGIALRSLRETMKLAFNLTFQGKPVGSYDLTTPCPLGGAARLVGTATSNAIQGATEVNITYVLDRCAYLQQDEDVKENYEMAITGTVVQDGVLAVQPSSTSALRMRAEGVTFTGTVYAPPVPYSASCPLELAQNGNKLTGKICGRNAFTDL